MVEGFRSALGPLWPSRACKHTLARSCCTVRLARRAESSVGGLQQGDGMKPFPTAR